MTEEKHKLESKYRTLSKANSAAIADAENLKQDNKKLRTQLHEATTSKTSELIDLKDKLEKMTQGNNLRWYILLKVTISVGPFSKFNRVLRLKLNVKLWFPRLAWRLAGPWPHNLTNGVQGSLQIGAKTMS